jgi:hypothetical protein
LRSFSVELVTRVLVETKESMTRQRHINHTDRRRAFVSACTTNRCAPWTRGGGELWAIRWHTLSPTFVLHWSNNNYKRSRCRTLNAIWPSALSCILENHLDGTTPLQGCVPPLTWITCKWNSDDKRTVSQWSWEWVDSCEESNLMQASGLKCHARGTYCIYVQVKWSTNHDMFPTVHIAMSHSTLSLSKRAVSVVVGITNVHTDSTGTITIAQ